MIKILKDSLSLVTVGIAALVTSTIFTLADAQSDARVIEPAVAASSMGGSLVVRAAPVVPDEGETSDWWAKCVVTQTCEASAQKRYGYGCPSSYSAGGAHIPAICSPRTCVYSCEKKLPSEICVDDWFWDCYDTTPADGTADDKECGKGILGHCNYVGTFWMGIGTTCHIASGCFRDRNTKDCGIAKTCYDID